jgi:hypothetical protein
MLFSSALRSDASRTGVMTLARMADFLPSATEVRDGSLASILTCQRRVRLDRNLGHAGGTGEEFRAGIQRSVDKGWLTRHESGTYVKFTPAGAELFA